MSLTLEIVRSESLFPISTTVVRSIGDVQSSSLYRLSGRRNVSICGEWLTEVCSVASLTHLGVAAAIGFRSVLIQVDHCLQACPRKGEVCLWITAWSFVQGGDQLPLESTERGKQTKPEQGEEDGWREGVCVRSPDVLGLRRSKKRSDGEAVGRGKGVDGWIL
jgi:hypothetical protein